VLKGNGRLARAAAAGTAVPRGGVAGIPEPAKLSMAAGEANGLLMDDTEYADEVDNEFVRGRMENVARVATGNDVKIAIGSGFWTDMNGTVQLDPHDPQKDAPAEDRILMMQGGLEHEICHELYYDKAAFAELQEQIQSDPSRSPVAFLNNVLADGHDEWRHKLKRPEAYEQIEAHDALFVAHNGSGRWSFDPERQNAWQQVTGAILYRGLPYYAVPKEKLSPEALAAYRECAQHVDAAVAGTSWDCLREANEIHDILKRRGVIPSHPETEHLKGGAGPGSGGAPGIGYPQGSSGEPDDQSLDEDAKSQMQGSGEPPDDAPGAPDGPPGSGTGSEDGSGFVADPDAGREALENRRGQARALANSAKSRAPQDTRRPDLDEWVPKTPGALADFRARWQKNRRLARDFASAIEEARTETLATKTRQESGRLDRRRRRALASGEDKVFAKRGRARKVDMSVELLVDLSDSMNKTIPDLKESTAIVSQGLDLAGIAHEVRGFADSDDAPVFRGFGESPDWRLGAMKTLGMTDLASGARRVREAFGGRTEKQKLCVVLTDGVPNSIPAAKAELATLRARGVSVLGVYLRAGGVQDTDREAKMREIFGGRVAVLDHVSQLPKVAGKKMADLLRRVGR